MNQLVNGVIVILTAIVGVAILSVILSRNSQTAGVIKAGSSGFSDILNTAMSPVTGSGIGATTSLGGWQ